jgi:hypothetical protein
MRIDARSGARVACALLAFGLAGAAAAATLDQLEQGALATPASADATWQLVKAYREQAANQRAVDFFTRFHQAHPPNAQSLVWQGSFKALLASKETDIEKRFDLLQTGTADMDGAVRQFSGDPGVRAVRGITLSRFPEFMKMSGKAIEDLETALRPGSGISDGLQAAAREALARAYRQAGRTADADALQKVAGAR